MNILSGVSTYSLFPMPSQVILNRTNLFLLGGLLGRALLGGLLGRRSLLLGGGLLSRRSLLGRGLLGRGLLGRSLLGRRSLLGGRLNLK